MGRISPGTWGAVQALLRASAAADYNLMARALVQMGATAPAAEVDIDAFAADLRALYESLGAIEPAVVVVAAPDGSPRRAAATVAVSDADVNRLPLDIVRVGENNGIRFPREFGLLLKQLLYFDRYNRRDRGGARGAGPICVLRAHTMADTAARPSQDPGAGPAGLQRLARAAGVLSGGAGRDCRTE